MLYPGLLHNFTVNLMLIRRLLITWVPWREASTPTYQAAIPIRVRRCKPMLLSSSVIGLLTIVAILLLIPIDASLTMLTHWDKLLVRIALTGGWHVLLKELSLNSFILVV